MIQYLDWVILIFYTDAVRDGLLDHSPILFLSRSTQYAPRFLVFPISRGCKSALKNSIAESETLDNDFGIAEKCKKFRTPWNSINLLFSEGWYLKLKTFDHLIKNLQSPTWTFYRFRDGSFYISRLEFAGGLCLSSRASKTSEIFSDIVRSRWYHRVGLGWSLRNPSHCL